MGEIACEVDEGDDRSRHDGERYSTQTLRRRTMLIIPTSLFALCLGSLLYDAIRPRALSSQPLMRWILDARPHV